MTGIGLIGVWDMWMGVQRSARREMEGRCWNRLAASK